MSGMGQRTKVLSIRGVGWASPATFEPLFSEFASLEKAVMAKAKVSFRPNRIAEGEWQIVAGYPGDLTQPRA
jgi:hypothetical protein